MARTFVNTSNQRMEFTGGGLDYPLTFACWVRPASTADNYSIFTSGTTGSNDNFHRLLQIGAGQMRMQSKTTAFSSATGTVAVTVGQWCHVAGTISGESSRNVFFNGGDKAGNSGTRTISGCNHIDIASQVGSSVASCYDGEIAEAGLWSIVLTDAEIAALARGVPVRTIRPASLWGYWPIWGIDSPEPDQSGNQRPMTLVNTPTAAGIHAPIRLWMPITMRPVVLPVVAPPPAGFVAPRRRFQHMMVR